MASLEHAVRVLRCFDDGRATLTLTQATQLLGLPKSNLSRLLRAMRDAGLLDAAEASRGYRLGAMIQQLASTCGNGPGLSARASSVVRRICDQLGYTGFVAVLRGTHVFGLAHHLGDNLLQVGHPLGWRLPVDGSATGRALLADMSDAEVEQLLGGQVSRASPRSPSTFADLLLRLQQIRRQGWSESCDEAGKGVGALAVALCDAQTGERLSICMTYPVAVLDPRERTQAIEMLLQARSELGGTR
jgi:DNA-binding IclR family transcriptional regulator